jgi:hypothetical protein
MYLAQHRKPAGKDLAPQVRGAGADHFPKRTRIGGRQTCISYIINKITAI